MATGPDLQDPALQQLARLLVNKQAAIARPGVTVPASPPSLPPFVQPGSEMARFQPPMQAAPPPVAPQAAPAPQALPPMAPPVAVAPQSPAPPMADTVPVGMDPAQPDVRAVIAEMQRRAFQNGPSPWTINQGSLRDQLG